LKRYNKWYNNLDIALHSIALRCKDEYIYLLDKQVEEGITVHLGEYKIFPAGSQVMLLALVN
jgi:hypothetical protein